MLNAAIEKLEQREKETRSARGGSRLKTQTP